MAFIPPRDRVFERSTSNSQTVFAVTGAIDTSYNGFSASMAVGDSTVGGVVEAGTAFVSGILTYSASNQVTVSTVFESKGTFSSGGVKEVFMGLPAARAYNAPFDAVAYGNMAVNAGVEISQELGTTGATLASGTAKHIADGIQARYVHGANTAVITSAQLAASSFPAVLSGYNFGHQIKATTALTSPANGDYALHCWIFEGYRIARLGFGASGAQPFSYGVQFYSTVSGVAFIKFSNSNKSRCYYQEQTIAAGWNWATGTIPGDTSGTWQSTNLVGLYVEIFAAGKAASPVAPGAWGSTSTTQTTNSTNLLGTSNNQTIATGLVMVPGLDVPPSSRAPFIMRPADQELALCQRQFWKSTGIAGGYPNILLWSTGAGLFIGSNVSFPVSMRAVPNVTKNGTWTTSNCSQPAINGQSQEGFLFYTTASGSGNVGTAPADATCFIMADARLTL